MAVADDDDLPVGEVVLLGDPPDRITPAR